MATAPATAPRRRMHRLSITASEMDLLVNLVRSERRRQSLVTAAKIRLSPAYHASVDREADLTALLCTLERNCA